MCRGGCGGTQGERGDGKAVHAVQAESTVGLNVEEFVTELVGCCALHTFDYH